MLPLSLDPACSWHVWILTALLVDSFEGRGLAHSSLLTSFFSCHRCLLKPMLFQPLSVDASFSCHPCLWASFSWDLLLLTFSSLHISFSWQGFRLAPFSCFLLFHTIILRPNCFLWHLMSWHLLCLESFFHSHISFFWHFRTLRTQFILWTTGLAQSPSCTTKPSQSISQYYFLLQSLHEVLPSTTSYYQACTKYSPVLLRTTKLAQSTSQYYIVLQSCTKYFPVLLHTTKLSQSTSQYYFLLQSLHKVLPSTASYCKACTKYFPVYNTSYCKACTKYFPVLLRTTKLLHTEALTQQSFYTQKLLHTEALHTEKLLRSKALTHRRFWHTHTSF